MVVSSCSSVGRFWNVEFWVQFSSLFTSHFATPDLSIASLRGLLRIMSPQKLCPWRVMSCGRTAPCPQASCLCPPPAASPPCFWRSVREALPDFPTESVHAPTLLPCHLLPLTAYLASLTFYVSLLSVLCENEDTVLVVRLSSAPPAAVTPLKGAAHHAAVG